MEGETKALYLADGRILEGHSFKEMLKGSNTYLETKIETLNALNVFPVPDGDTGTNMSLTLTAAVKGMENSETNNIGAIADIAAANALMGARGNSGVILSQFLQGIARGLSNQEKAGALQLAKAFQYGVVMAYRAVSMPVEGTILTVAREMAKGAKKVSRENPYLVDLLQVAVESGQQALERTKEQLPQLKEAGVVDAGGYGLVVIMEGCLKALRGDIKLEGPGEFSEFGRVSADHADIPIPGKDAANTITYTYCTEAAIKGANIRSERLKEELSSLGNAMMVVGNSSLIKVHIHTNHPGIVLESCLKRGTLHNIKIDNMLDQHMGKLASESEGEGEEEREEVFLDKASHITELISVCNGPGLEKIFKGFGVSEIITGGPTMNPRVQDFVERINRLKGSIIILPNDKNIRLAAEQAVQMVNREAIVIPTENIVQGIAAAMVYNGKSTLETNKNEMNERIKEIKSGEVTFAVRDSKFGDQVFNKGEKIGLVDGNIIASGDSRDAVLFDTLKSLVDEEKEIISIIYGEDVDEGEADSLQERLAEIYPDLEIEFLSGGQPLYCFLISVE